MSAPVSLDLYRARQRGVQRRPRASRPIGPAVVLPMRRAKAEDPAATSPAAQPSLIAENVVLVLVGVGAALIWFGRLEGLL